MTEQYHFTHNDEKYSIPYLTNLKTGLKADVLEGVAEIETAPHKIYKALFSVAALDSKDAVDAVRDMDDEQFKAFVQGWVKSSPGVSGK
jgi:hypothetical protein